MSKSPKNLPTDVMYNSERLAFHQLPSESLYRDFFSESGKIAFDLGFSWFRHLASSVDFGDEEPLLYALRRGHEMRVALPMRLPSASGHRAEALSNYYTTLYAPIVANDAGMLEVASLIKSISNDYPSLSEMRFAPLDPNSPTTKILRNALQTSGWRTFTYFAFGNWYLPVEGDWETYLRTRSGSLRSNIRRAEKKFAASGGRLEIFTRNEESLAKASDAFQVVYGASWKPAEPHPNFIPGLIDLLASDGRLRLGIAWIADTPVAAQIWIVNHGKANIYKVAYDEKYSAISPATVLTAHLMAYVIDVDRVHEVDYLMGDDQYKSNWMSHRRERYGIVAYKFASLRGFLGFAREFTVRAIKKLMQRMRIGNRELQRLAKLTQKT